MGNSPDLAPFDYGINGSFKQNLSRSRATTVDGLHRAIVKEWANFDLKCIRKILSFREK